MLIDIINLAVDESEKKLEQKYTKKGTLRKRRRFDTSVEERKRVKKANKIEKHILRETCGDGCSRKCLQNISKERQIIIHSEYWNLPTENHQRQFIFSSVKNTVKKKSCVGEDSRRQKNKKIFFERRPGCGFPSMQKIFFRNLRISSPQ